MFLVCIVLKSFVISLQMIYVGLFQVIGKALVAGRY
jgi:hypothetical protein